MEEQLPGTQPVTTARTGRLLPLALGVVIGALAVLTWKPWADAPDASRTSPSPAPGATVAASAVPSGGVTPAAATASPGPREVACLSTDGWRIVTLERTAGRDVRTWIAVDPAAARSPTAATIPTDRISAGRLLALGFCPPLGVLPDSGAETVRFWRLTTRGAGGPVTGARPLGTPPLSVPLRPGYAQLYGPPGGRQDWAPGRYVFEVVGPEPTGGSARPRSFWFGVEVFRADEPPL